MAILIPLAGSPQINNGGGGGSDLPAVTAEDNGDVLTVVNGEWNKAAPSGGGGVLVTVAVYDEVEQTLTLDKTAREIISALPLAFETEESADDNHNYHRVIGYENYGEYVFAVESYEDSNGFVAATLNDYPVLDMK